MTNKEALNVIASAQNTVKEDIDMTDSKAITFEVNGTTYNSNDKGNRFYKMIGTQKVRISEAEWNRAFDAYTSTIEPPAVDEWEAEADAERQARYNKMAEDALRAAEVLNPKEVVKTANETVKKTKKKAAVVEVEDDEDDDVEYEDEDDEDIEDDEDEDVEPEPAPKKKTSKKSAQ